MTITKRPFGVTKSGTAVDCYTLTNGGLSAEILTYGGILRALRVPAADGVRDVVLGFDCLADYEAQDKYIGAVVGRVANRIGGARFTLDGVDYALAANDGENCLHGGVHSFHEKVWQADETETEALVLSYFSAAGEEGFPGNVWITVTYTLTEEALSITYHAHADAATLVNLTNHSYFNLSGQGSGSIGAHRMQIFADTFTENRADGIPTGRLLPVDGTPFDLRTPQQLQAGLLCDHPQIVYGRGYDHNFVLKRQWDAVLSPAAVLEAEGLQMSCSTTQPGIQLYTANYLTGERGKGGAVYPPRSGVCLETQNWPDAVNHPAFPSPILRPGEVYHQTTVYRFSAI